MTYTYPTLFWQLLHEPFHRIDMVWGIVPLYFGWFVNEITSPKASFKTAIQTGFGFLWAGAHWTYQYLHLRPSKGGLHSAQNVLPANLAVTALVLAIGLVALISGLRHKYPRYASFLGHTRFSNYFMIAIFPIQSGYLPWSWDRVIAIIIFALPIWVALHFGLMPMRK